MLAELVGALPAGVVATEPELLEKYRRDRAADPNAGTPLAAVRAETTEQVQTTVRWAARHRVPVVARGAGTGLSGGATAVDGGIVLSLERMRSVHVDPVSRIAVAQPGALNVEVKAAAATHGLWYPPDPSSFEICSIGGNVATNAGGLCCVKYGVTTDYVLGLEVVLADGAAVRLGGARLKDVAGLSLTKLFVGSEGSLGIVTEATLRLLPAQPPTCTLVATFPTMAAATSAILAITAEMRPAMLELMDRTSINAVEDMFRMGLDRSAAALVVARTDAQHQSGADELRSMVEACEKAGATEVLATDDPDEGEAFVVARRSVITALEPLGTLLLEDVGVALPRLPELVAGVEAIAAARDVTIAIVAHAGDGNTHPLIVVDPTDAEMARRADLAFGEVMALALRLDGTITGEHGVGRLKLPWLSDQLGPEVLDLSWRIKNALDPLNILNPGAALPPSNTPQPRHHP
ncbi:FAD-binding protein [Frankia sp. AgB1.9]|uniref:FAD-binding oxidoreductase n=1 Tax=unclassified Frankia TaxID=2632575 RepID=UPI0019335E91|nr:MULTISPECIES: FAD-linked oxidase C-terminal domain-containing protein [unclassified Frankia]MBL7492426.1 FAD-binding protein [Frankia sp. AgW1.1]MBL7549382.1 FAD-binding protein [Frankia sp. AgB1.9]MBL7623415.1 FAD-binding protein [Frankia sp. AgB1.8]